MFVLTLDLAYFTSGQTDRVGRTRPYKSVRSVWCLLFRSDSIPPLTQAKMSNGRLPGGRWRSHWRASI